MPSRNWFVALAIAALLIGIPSAGRPVAAVDVTHTTFLPLVTKPVPPCSVPPTLVSPADGAQLNTLIPFYQFNNGDGNGVTRYGLDVARDAGFSQRDYYVYWPNPTTTAGFRADRSRWNLSPATTYYWRTYLTCGTQTIYSTVRSFRTGSGGVMLESPAILEPANGAVLGPGAPVIKWSPVPGALEYRAWLYDPISGSGGSSNTTATTITLGWLRPNTRYDLRVNARNDYAWGYYRLGQYFTTGPAAGAAALDAMPAGFTVTHVNEAGEAVVVVEPNTE